MQPWPAHRGIARPGAGAHVLRRSCAAIAATLLVAGCGGEERRASLRGTGPFAEAIAAPVRLRGDYVFNGRRRHVDVRIAPVGVIDPYEPPAITPGRGRRLIGVQYVFVDGGPDPFPREWASFGALDDHGRRLAGGAYASELRKPYPSRPRRGQPLTQILAFEVPEGRRLGAVTLGSIVALWPFRGRWDLSDAPRRGER